MKKFILPLVVVALIISASFGTWWYSQKPQVADAQIAEIIQKNYITDQHHLDLRGKSKGVIPDICAGVVGTKLIDDIWSVDLANNELTSISLDLSCLHNLRELNLSFNQLTNIKNLDKLLFLSKLDIGNNKLTKISGLDALTQLQDLHVGYNQITSTAGLEKLANLTSLQLQHNALEDISAVAAMTKLETLKLEYNKLTDEDIAFLPALTRLKVITVAENQIDPAKVEELNQKTRGNMEASEAKS